MSRSTVFRDVFYEDARKAAVWYENQRRGLGVEFLDELDAAAKRLLDAPELFTPVSNWVRVCRLRRFPYGIYFRISADELVVTAVLHLHRDDSIWQSRQ